MLNMLKRLPNLFDIEPWKRSFFLMKGLLLAGGLVLTTCSSWAVSFSDLSFDAACKTAAASGKIVLVDFYTTWCGPCKMLDKNTWTDPAVTRLLDSKTVALRIDAEKETALAKRYHIEAYPSVLLLKPDGKEIDRLVGYRDPKTFIADFTSSLNGKDSVARAKDALKAAGEKDPMARLTYATALAQKGKPAEALSEYLWCFDHGSEASPAFAGVRLSFLLSYIKNLGTHYPAAIQALESRRDDRLAQLKAGAANTNPQTAMDLIALNNALDQSDQNLAVFDKLPPDSPARAAVARMIAGELLQARRYADALDGLGGKSGFEQQMAHFNVMTTGQNKQMKSALSQYAIGSGVHIFEALAGLKRDADGKELAQQILKFDASKETREQLAQAATRAGNSPLASYAKEYQPKATANAGG